MDLELIKKEIGNNNYRYDDLCTEFSCEGTKYLPFGQYSCFYRVTKTKYLQMNNTYHIILYKCFNSNYNNFCFFSAQEIKEYLAYIEEIVGDLNFSVEDNCTSNVNGDEALKINLTINAPHLIHTFVLTMIRYLYEHRYVTILDDALSLKKTYLFRNMNIYSLLCLVASSNCKSIELSDDMSHFAARCLIKIYSTEELKGRISFACSKASVCKQKDPWNETEIEVLSMPGIQALQCHTKCWDDRILSTIEQAGLSDIKNYEQIPENIEKLNKEFANRYRIYRDNYFKMTRHAKEHEKDYIDDLKSTSLYYVYAAN